MSGYISRSKRPHSVKKHGVGYKYLKGDAKKAYKSWSCQRQRCYNKNRSYYKYYGAKGIEVKYSSAEYIAWWVEQQSILKLKNPTVSRIDHDGHYEFGNIKLEEHSENCVVDVRRRHPRAAAMSGAKKILVFKIGSEKPCGQFGTIVQVAKFFNVERTRISSRLRGKVKNCLSGYYFKYGEL